MIQATHPFLEKYCSLFVGGPVRGSAENVDAIAGRFGRFESAKEKLIIAKKISFGFAGISAAALAVTIVASVIIGGAFWPIPAVILLLSLTFALTNWQAKVYLDGTNKELLSKTLPKAIATQSALHNNITQAKNDLIRLEGELIRLANSAPKATGGDEEVDIQYNQELADKKSAYLTNYNLLSSRKDDSNLQNILAASRTKLDQNRVNFQ